MSEFADLGFRIRSEDASTAEQRLDRMTAAAVRAEGATDRLGDESARAGSAIASMLASIERTVRSMEGLMRAQAAAAGAANDHASSQSRANAEVVKAYAVTAKYSATLTGLQSGFAGAAAGAKKLGDEVSGAGDDAKRAAMHFDTLYDHAQRDFTGQWSRGAADFGKTAGKATVETRKLTLAGLDLSRQFADIGVTAAMGMNPLMILVQQGPQIADRMAMMKMEGIGLRQALGGIARAIGPVMIALLPFAAAAAASAIGFGLLHRELKKGFPKDVTDGMKLTEEQLERVKHKTVTMGDTWKATLDVMGKYMMQGPVGDGIKWLGKTWGDFLDFMAKATFETVASVVGVFLGGYKAIVRAWDLLPAALGSAFAMAVNAGIDALQKLLNAQSAVTQALKTLLGVLAPTLAPMLNQINDIDLSGFKMSVSSAGQFLTQTVSSAMAEGQEDARRGMRKIGQEISAGALKIARDRALKEAGKADKVSGSEASTPRDQTDERTAQIAAQIAQAMQDELQARLAITREASERADLERQIAAAVLAEKQAQVDRQIANIADDKGLSDEKKKELTAQLLIVQAMNGRTAAIRDIAITEAETAQLSREALDTQRGALQNHIDLLGAQADLLVSGFARAVVEQDILKAQQELEKATLRAVTVQNGATAAQERDAKARLAILAQVHGLELEQAKRQTRLVNAIGEATSAVRGFKDAFRRHDWAGVFDELQATIETIQASFAANGLSGGLMTAGSAAAQLIGGKTGRAIGGGLGIAAGLGSLGAGLVTAGSMGALGSGLAASLAIQFAPLLGPIGLAAGALYAAAKIFNVGGKPSNKGAGFDLVTGQLSGNKRDEQTEGAARAAGEAILGIQDALKAAGIGLTDTVKGLVIGTRDQTQIYLASGKTLLSAVGDSGAAVDTAMRALLEGATYVSDAQKKLVDSAVAAGKGFDAIAEILAAYEGAQNIGKGLADEILRLTNPQAFDTEAVKREIDAQRKAYAELATEGYLTADQLAGINAQLTELEGLRLHEVLKRYSDAIEEATEAFSLEQDFADARSATDAARSALVQAYEAEAAVHREAIDRYRQIADGLRDFKRELTVGSLAANDPFTQYARTKAEFDRLNAMAADNPERMANLQTVGQAFIEASRARSPSQEAFDRDLAAVRIATEASEKAAGQQADLAQLQLDALNTQVGLLTQLNAGVLSLAQAIAGLQAALAVEKQLGVPANDNFDATKYGAANPDLIQNWMEGGILRQSGSTLEEALAAHYRYQYPLEAGVRPRGFAAGGMHTGGMRLVGEQGPELEVTGPARYFSADDTRAMLGGSGDGELADAVQALARGLSSMASEVRGMGHDVHDVRTEFLRARQTGVWVRGQNPEDPVETAAA